MSTVAALDFFSGRAHAILAQRLADGSWRLLGSGSAPLDGIEEGCVRHLSDAAETVAAALAQAAQASGRRYEAVFYTLHDPRAALKRVRASRLLPGEGQIRPADVRAVFSAAERLAGCFETVNICASTLGFVIDEQDPVVDPVGVFGRKLEIEAGFLQAPSEALDAWNDVFRRACGAAASPVALVQAAVWGALGAAPEGRRAVVLARDGGSVVCRAFGPAIEAYEYVSENMEEAVRRAASGAAEIVVAGENTGRLVERLSKEAECPARPARPEILSGMHAPEHAGLAGLLTAAGRKDKPNLYDRRGKGLARKVRRRLTAFWNEYF